jgi:transposase
MDLSSTDRIILTRINCILPLLNERQRRVYLGTEAQSIGWGGITKIHRLTGVNRQTIAAGLKESGQEKEKTAHIRNKGGGRKKEVEKFPHLLQEIMEIVSPHIMGDPGNPLIWCSKSIRKIQQVLQKRGYQISHETIRKCLQILGFSLQANKKTKEGGEHPDRDAQFEHINAVAKEFLSSGDPVISVDGC